MYLSTDQENAIAQGKVLGFLLMGKNPCPLNVIFAAEKLQLQPEQISAALRALEMEGRIELVLTRAIVTLRDVPTGEPPLHIAGVLATYPGQSDTPPETIAPTKLDSELAKKGAK